MSTELLPWMGVDYQSEVIVQYEAKGLLTRPFVRVKRFVGASQTQFKLYGSKKATRRGAGQKVPVSESNSPVVACPVYEDSVGDYIDKTEALSHNSDEKMPMVEVATSALGRACDQAVYDAVKTGASTTKKKATLTYDMARNMVKTLKQQKVPRSELVCFVGPSAFDQLLAINEFKSRDFVDVLPIPELQAKKWLGVTWVEDCELAPETGDAEMGYMWAQSAVGYGYTQDIETEWSWNNEYKSYFLRADIVHGACVIQPKGALKFSVPA